MPFSRMIGGIAAAAVSLLALAAEAADLPSKKSPAALPVATFSWAGFYAGVSVGASQDRITENNLSYSTAALPPPPATLVKSSPDFGFGHWAFIGGLTGGYNFQWDKVVAGLEADLLLSGGSGSGVVTATPTAADAAAFPGYALYGSQLTVTHAPSWSGNIRARVGFTPIDRLLIFATGGLAVSRDKFTTDLLFVGLAGPFAVSKTATRPGWVLGLGGEYAITEKVSVKAEYLYTRLNNTNVMYPATATTQRTFAMQDKANLFRVGVNYHF